MRQIVDDFMHEIGAAAEAHCNEHESLWTNRKPLDRMRESDLQYSVARHLISGCRWSCLIEKSIRDWIGEQTNQPRQAIDENIVGGQRFDLLVTHPGQPGDIPIELKVMGDDGAIGRVLADIEKLGRIRACWPSVGTMVAAAWVPEGQNESLLARLDRVEKHLRAARPDIAMRMVRSEKRTGGPHNEWEWCLLGVVI